MSVEFETFLTEWKWVRDVLSDLVVLILDNYQNNPLCFYRAPHCGFPSLVSVFYCIEFFKVLFYFYRECITTRSTPQHTSEFRSRHPPYITNLQSRVQCGNSVAVYIKHHHTALNIDCCPKKRRCIFILLLSSQAAQSSNELKHLQLHISLNKRTSSSLCQY